MKKHFLSKYGTVLSEEHQSDKLLNYGATELTRASGESSDPDEFLLMGCTVKTASRENSDPDEFMLFGPTIVTENVENSDPDEFCFTDEIKIGMKKENVLRDYDNVLNI